jgi:hypothetical protein
MSTGTGMDDFTELSGADRGRGAVVLQLLEGWSRWVDRRVESVTFPDPDSIRRRLSVDFTPAHGFTTPLPDAWRALEHFAPLTLMRKEGLANFSLRDETGRALPLPTRRQNSRLAAATLVSLAEVRHRGAVEGVRAVPVAIQRDFYELSRARLEDAFGVWDRLGEAGDAPEPGELEWRSLVVADRPLMSLARDLAANFVVFVEVGDALDRRRIVKYSFDEVIGRPRRTPWRQRRRRRTVRPPVEHPSEGCGILNLSVELSRDETAADEAPVAEEPAKTESDQPPPAGAGESPAPPSGVGESPAPEQAGAAQSPGGQSAGETGDDGDPDAWLREVTFIVQDEDGQVRMVNARPDGGMSIQVPVGRHTVTALVPLEVVVDPPSAREVEVAVGAQEDVVFRARRAGGAASMDPGVAELLPPLTWRQWIARGIGWAPERLVFPTPSVGQAASYHFEVELPEGLQITKGRLSAGLAYPAAPRGGSAAAPFGDVVAQTVQRIHLYVEDVPQQASGVAVVRLRARSAGMVDSAFVAALVTTALLGAAAWRWDEAGPHLGSLVTLLLVVPGGLAAYAATRPGEHRLTARVLFGVRALSLLTGLLSFLAAALLLLGREWSPASSRVAVAADPGWWFQAALIGLAAATGAIAAALWRTRRRAKSPPEQKIG